MGAKVKLTRALLMLAGGGLLVVSLTLVFARLGGDGSPQTRPRQAETTPGTQTVIVRKGGNLQAAINAARPGQTIELEAGATFPGPILLPRKPGDGYITIRSSRAGELPEGVRVGPAQSALMPKVVSKGQGNPALQTEAGAHHYRLIGLEILPETPETFVYTLVWLGAGDNSQNTMEKVPHHITVDRCYIHAWPDQSLKRGIDLNSAHTEVINSHISGFKAVGQEAQAILGYNGPGPFRIENNYLEGAGENVMFGGGDPLIPNLVPSDITIRRNHFFKPLAWRGKWQVKNLFELKNARRVEVSGNVFENCWADAQAGNAIVLTTRNQQGTAPWSVVEDVRFVNNHVKGAGGGVQILGKDDLHPSARGGRLHIVNNLFEDLSARWSNEGLTRVFVTLSGAGEVEFDHNTVISPDATIVYVVPGPAPGFRFTNNIVKHNNGGIISEGMGPPQSYTQFLTPFVIKGNAMIGALEQYWDVDQKYPPGNFYPGRYEDVRFVDYQGGNFSLSTNSPLKRKGTDGKDVGVDMEELRKALAGAVTGGL
jgi:hypothetical protein